MQHVRVALDANGREAEVHPMYDLLLNAPYLGRVTAMHWNFTGEELGVMHYLEGDIDAFEADIRSIEYVLAYELTPADGDSFYAYIRDAQNEVMRSIMNVLNDSPVVVIPPAEYTDRDTIEFSVFGPGGAIQAAIESLPDVLDVEVTEVSGMAAVPGLLDSLLTDRQREAVDAALELGYYEIPRTTDHEAVADAIDCAPSTAAQHLRKAESRLLRSMLAD